MEDNKKAVEEKIYGVSFSLKWNRTLVHRSTLRVLGHPKYIRFLYNRLNNHIAIQACAFDEKDSVRVNIDWRDKDSFEVKSQGLAILVKKFSGWDEERSYRVYGIYQQQYDLVDYDLNTAVIIRDEQFEVPEQ